MEISFDDDLLTLIPINYQDGVLVKNTKLTSRRAVAIKPEDNLLEKSLINNDEIYQRYITYTFLKR